MLENLLSERRQAILKRWFQSIVETYPTDAAGLLKREKDQFLNPVGFTISQEIETIYEELLQGMNLERLSQSLDNIIRIRAVQDFSPSQAIAFVFLLKGAIREELEGKARENGVFGELSEFEFRIDRVALLAFDIYMKCREKIYNIRANEVKERSAKLLERMNLMYGIGRQDLGLPDHNSDNVT